MRIFCLSGIVSLADVIIFFVCIYFESLEHSGQKAMYLGRDKISSKTGKKETLDFEYI